MWAATPVSGSLYYYFVCIIYVWCVYDRAHIWRSEFPGFGELNSSCQPFVLLPAEPSCGAYLPVHDIGSWYASLAGLKLTLSQWWPWAPDPPVTTSLVPGLQVQHPAQCLWPFEFLSYQQANPCSALCYLTISFAKGEFNSLYENMQTRGWRTRLVVKSACCSHREPRSYSHSSYSSLWLSVTPVPREGALSSGLCGRQTLKEYTNMQAGKVQI